jgi:hexosaminidase
MDTVIDVWKGNWQNEMKAVTSGGFKTILSSCWYLDHISYGTDWHQYYACDPQSFNGTDGEMANVIGGHASLWAEYVDSTNFISRMWPRASAVAERLWSPKTVVSLTDAAVRIDNHRCRLLR